MGWSLKLPSIVRKGHAGLPRFQDAVLVNTNLQSDTGTDDYYIDGKLLVSYTGTASLPPSNPPVATISATVPAALPTVSGHPWAAFLTEVFDGARYFFNGLTWVKQTKSGHYIQFGNLLNNAKFGILDGGGTEVVDGITAAVATAKSVGDSTLNPIYRWNLVADTDATGNTVYYVWNNNSLLLGFPTNNGTGNGQNYLMDVYDTPSQFSSSLSVPIPSNVTFAHHVHLSWTKALNAATQGAAVLSNPPWKAPPYALLTTVDVTSATWGSANRELVREYQLAYLANSSGTQAFLNTITEVGDCAEATSATGVTSGGVVESNGIIASSAVAGCRKLPATTYTYTGVNLPAGSPGSLGFAAAPVKSSSFLDAAQVLGLWDMNGDGAADFIGWHTAGHIFNINNPALSSVLVNPAPLEFQLSGLSSPAAGFTTGSPTYTNLNRTYSQIQGARILGDWGSTGNLTMLVMEAPNFAPWDNSTCSFGTDPNTGIFYCQCTYPFAQNTSPFVYTFSPPPAGQTVSSPGLSVAIGVPTPADVSRLETLITNAPHQIPQSCEPMSA